MSAKTTLVVTALPNPTEMDAVQEYLKGVGPLFAQAGGSPVKRLKVEEVLQGDASGMVLVMDFESSDAVTALFGSDEYAALLPARDRGFSQMNILLSHEM